MKDLFTMEFSRNNGFPVGGGLWLMFHPEDKLVTPYSEWTFPGEITRMPEFLAPALGNRENVVTIDATVPADANGVLYSLGGFSGGLTCYIKDGVLAYEYNLFEIQRTSIKAQAKLPTGRVKIEVETTYAVKQAAGPLEVILKVSGKEVARGRVPVSAPLLFTANDCLDIGSDLGSPVSLDYYEAAPFRFNGKIDQVQVKYLK
jgi:arylsulfatase